MCGLYAYFKTLPTKLILFLFHNFSLIQLIVQIIDNQLTCLNTAILIYIIYAYQMGMAIHINLMIWVQYNHFD